MLLVPRGSSAMKYPVNDIYPCIQGEGCQTGLAMIMLRLQGCPVGCPWCDTKETWFIDDLPRRKRTIKEVLGANPLWCEVEASDLAHYIDSLTHGVGTKWVLVSGGEPALNNLEPLVRELHGHGYKAAIETSGTALGHVGAGFDWITISPKIDMPGGYQIKERAFEDASEVKFPVGKPDDIRNLDRLIERGIIKAGTTICLQPLSLSPRATTLCEETAQHRGWRLSVQVHKLLNLR
jgi:7-carboxy-7-deazaguanine synthase